MSKARQLAQKPNQTSGRKNLIINGAMQVAQRATSATGITSGDYYTLDRMRTVGNMTTRSYSQDSNAPSGFANSLKVEITTADASPDAGAFLTVEQLIEGQNLQHLKKGTSDAKAITASFWVKSNVAGTYILEVDDIDNARKINKSYTINSANTWEYKTITFEGDTTGTLDDDNFGSMRIIWWLDAGSNFRSGTLGTSWQAGVTADRVVGNVSFGNTVGNTWQITGVQLEVGSTATEFEHRSYGEELALCRRYYKKITAPNNTRMSSASIADTTTRARFTIHHNIQMRVAPTVSETNLDLDGSDISSLFSGTSVDLTDIIAVKATGSHSVGDILQVHSGTTTATLEFEAEL